ncbi:MAG TPA: hypothetical protein VES62_07800 [Thermoleophilaceae bacterium]|nr:hypothetical protein [Thermoleophilaceae bacterium]
MTNQIDPLERRMITELPRQLDQAVRPFDAAAIARVATTRSRPSVLRITTVTAVVAIAAITAVVAVEGLSGSLRQPGSPGAPSSTPQDSTRPAAALDQLAAIQRADAIISTSLTAGESALVVNAHGAVVESCMQELGWDFRVGTATADTESIPGSLSQLEQWTFTDVASAESVGFDLQRHIAEAAAYHEVLERDAGEAHIPDPVTMSPEDAARYELDYFGTEDERVEILERDGSHSSLAGGGCWGQAQRAVFGDDMEREMWLRDARGTAESDIWEATLSDDAVNDALDSWKGCVRERGHEFEDPHGAFDSAANAARAGDFDQERSIATTHAECVAESNLDLAVAAAFLSATNATLPEFEDDLLALQQLEEDALGRAKDILGFEY